MFHHFFFLPMIVLFVLVKLLPLVLIGVIAYAVIRGVTRRRQVWGRQPWNQYPGGVPPMNQPYQQLSAMEILRQRYARGEIDGVTFQQMRERLEASAVPPTQTQG